MTEPLEKGQTVKITGERGEFTIMGTKVEADGRTVVTVHGGSRPMIRSFYIERVKVPKRRKSRNVSG